MVEVFEKEERKRIEKTLIDKHRQVSSLTRWERYRKLQNAPVPKPDIIIAEIEEVEKINLKLAAVFSLLLLTGSRICEILPYKYIWVKNQLVSMDGRKIPMTYERYKELKYIIGIPIPKPAIQYKDIEEVETEDGKKWLAIKSRVEKYHDVNNTHYKTAWLLYDESEYYFKLLEIVKRYINTELPNTNPETQLFTFTHNHVREKIAQYLGLTPHILRNYCAKYLVWYKHFTPQDLMFFFQWKGVEQAMSYSKSDQKRIQDRMLGKDPEEDNK